VLYVRPSVCLLTERGLIGFEKEFVVVEGGSEVENVITLPLMRVEGSDDRVAVEWEARTLSELDWLLPTRSGTVVFNDGDNCASISVELNSEWVEMCAQLIKIQFELVKARDGASLHHHRTSELQLLPGELKSSLNA